jgi:hypothetical protein
MSADFFLFFAVELPVVTFHRLKEVLPATANPERE